MPEHSHVGQQRKLICSIRVSLNMFLAVRKREIVLEHRHSCRGAVSQHWQQLLMWAERPSVAAEPSGFSRVTGNPNLSVKCVFLQVDIEKQKINAMKKQNIPVDCHLQTLIQKNKILP